MATWDDVARIAGGLPDVVEGDRRQWRVNKRLFAWERPLRPSDLTALGDAAPAGAILGVHVADLGVKEALLAERAAAYFTTPHFNGYPAVLVQLDRVPLDELEEVLVEAWLDRAPKRVAAQYLREHPPPA